MTQWTRSLRNLSNSIQRRGTSGKKHLSAPRQIVSVIGSPMVCGQTHVGTEHAPDVLRAHGLAKRINECGYMVEDLGDLDFPKRSVYGPRKRYKDVVGEGTRIIAEKWSQIADDPSKFLLMLGGDQSISIGSIAASLKVNSDTVTVWVDAHTNLRTPLNSESVNYHQMPVAFAMRLPGTECEHFNWLDNYPVLQPENLIYIGLRYLHETEKMIVQSKGIKTFTMFDIDQRGIGQVMKEVLDAIENRPIHLSFDVDVCDAFYVRNNAVPIRGGLTFRESHFVCESLADTGNLTSLDICEVNPLLEIDTENSFFAATISMIESCLGKHI